jgi:ABC-2 type transport system permease protein
MVNYILEIMKKEISSYFNQKSAILRNVLFLGLFGGLTIYQLTKVVDQYGTTAAIISSGLNVLLALAAIFPVQMAGGISVMAFPVERDQKTLEHLLSLPLSDRQIFLGKFLAAVVTGIVGLALILVIVFSFVFFSYNVAPGVLLSYNSLDLMAFAICPLLVVLLILMTVAVSSHISARETYIVNIFSVFILMGLNIAVASLNIDPFTFNAIVTAILAIGIVIMYLIGIGTFNRESLVKSL